MTRLPWIPVLSTSVVLTLAWIFLPPLLRQCPPIPLTPADAALLREASRPSATGEALILRGITPSLRARVLERNALEPERPLMLRAWSDAWPMSDLETFIERLERPIEAGETRLRRALLGRIELAIRAGHGSPDELARILLVVERHYTEADDLIQEYITGILRAIVQDGSSAPPETGNADEHPAELVRG